MPPSGAISHTLLAGLGLGLSLALVSIAIGCVIGLAMAFALLSKHRLLRVLASVYVTVIRNTPILVLILLIYFALPSLGIRLDKLPSFVITLSLYAGAYLTEVFRGGLLSIHKGQREAGLAIGLGEWQVKAYITVPVMLRNVLPALSNNFISLFKDTLPGGGDCRAGADLLRPQDQRGELPGDRNLAGDHGPVCRGLLPHCHGAALFRAAPGDPPLGVSHVRITQLVA